MGEQTVDVPDIRRTPFDGANFWEHVELPKDEPWVWDYGSETAQEY